MSNFVTKAVIGLFAFIFIVAMVSTCNNSQRTHRASSNYNSNSNSGGNQVVTIMPDQALVSAGDEFDLKILDTLLRKTTSPQELEKQLNASEPRLHNLDLDEDGKVDFIKVSEFGSGNERGLSFTVDLAPENGEPQTQEIASVTINKTGEKDGYYEVRGNSNMYGANHYYHSGFGIGDYLLISALMNNNGPGYRSGYGYNNYPSYYGNRAPMDNNSYRTATGGMSSSSSMRPTSTLNSKLTSPDAGKTAANVRAPLKNPTATQRSFQSRNPSRQVRSGGFGGGTPRPSTTTSSSSSPRPTTKPSTSSSSSSRPSSPSVRSSSSSRSGGSGGGGK